MANISVSGVWDTYVQHFNFTQLGWIFETFNSKAEDDYLMSFHDLQFIIEEWLDYQWHDVLARSEPDEKLLQRTLERNPLPLNFVNFVDVLKRYEAAHLEIEQHAGFPLETIWILQEIFDSHAAGSVCGGLKGKALFAVLHDLDIQFHTKEERQWYVDTVKRLDKNGDGSICFDELCQIIRTVVDMELLKKRVREFELIKVSKLPLDEVEDWNVLYQTQDEQGQGEMELIQVKDLVASIGVKWDNDFSVTVKQWLHEADENNNGTIDFGEFCLLIGKLWSSNLHDIRGASRKFLKKDTIVSLKGVHGFFVSVNEQGEVMARAEKTGPCETFTMIRLPSGNATFKGAFGKSLVCIDEKVECTGDSGTQFKVLTLEDERVQLTASSQFGGTLFANINGYVAISDGNPADEPNFPFVLIKQDELAKKCWSRLLPKRKPSKLVVTNVERRRARSKEVPVEAVPMSPGIQSGIDDMEKALEDNKLSRNNSKP